MAESKYKGGESGNCTCKRKDPPDPFCPHPGEGESIRRLIKTLEEELETYTQNEAVTSFRTELKDADKEYQGIDTVVGAYRKFYDKLECGTLPDARQGKEDLATWCKEKVPSAVQAAIEKLQDSYKEKEKKVCCKWIELREQLFYQSDCLTQAAKKVSDAKDDYEAHKGFEKTLGTRFTELKSLFEKATKLRTDGKHQSVCAARLEYDDLYEDLGEVPTWEYQQDKCRKPGECGPPKEPCAEKFQPTPDEFADGLTAALRKLIEEKYQHFRWSHEKLETVAASKKNKEDCDKARSTRRDEFILEAQDVKAATTPAAPSPAAPSRAAQSTPTTYEVQV